MGARPRWIRNLKFDSQHFEQLGLGIWNQKFVRYIFIPEGESRPRSIRLTSKDVQIINKNKKIANWEWGNGNAKNGYLVHLHGLKHGHTKLIAKSTTSKKKSILHVHVGRPKYLFVSFRPVRSTNWEVTPDSGRMERILNRLNRVYRNQGNIRFRQVASQQITVPDLPDKVMKSDMKKLTQHRSSSADVTVFLVADFEVFGTSWKNLIVFDAGTTKNGGRDTKIVCHEIGHFMGLPHPKPKLDGNLMNKGNENQPEWVAINGRQIETISVALNWK